MSVATTFRPRSSAEVLDAAAAVLRSHYLSLVTVSAVLTLPVIVLQLTLSDVWLRYLPFGQLLWTPVVQGGSVLVASAALLGRDLEPAAAVRQLGPAIPRLLLAVVLSWVMTVLGFCILIIPGLMFLATFFAVPMAVLLEDASSVEGALRRSSRLVGDATGRVLGVMLMAILIAAAVGAAAGAVTGGVFGGLGIGGRPLLVAMSVSGLLAAPISSVVLTVLYYDLRVRTEGFDMDLLASDLDGQRPALVDAPVMGAVPVVSTGT